jgi:hypothetical protein
LQAAGVGGLAGGAGELASVAGQRVLPADVSRTTQALVAGGLGGATEAAIEGANPITGALGSALQTARITSAQDAEAARRADEIRRQQVISAFEQPTTPGVGTQLGLATAGVDIAYYESDGRLRIITDATPEEIALAPSNASFITTEGGQITRSEAAASVKPSNVVGTKALFGLGTPDPSSPYAAAFGGSTGALNPGWYAMLAVDGNVPPATVIQELETFKTPANKDIVDAAINKVKDVQITAVINKTTPQDVVRNIYVEDLNNAKNVVAEANRAVNLTAGGAVEGATGVSGEAGGRLGLTDTTPSTQTTTTGASTDTSLISPVLSTIRTPEIVVGRGVGSAAGTGTTGSRDQNILDLTGIRTEVGGTQTDTTGTGAASGAGAGAATGTGTGAGVTGDGSGAGVSGFGPGAGGTGTGTGRGVGAGEGEGGGTPGKTEDETKKITEDTLTPIITRPPIIDDPTRIIDYRYFNVVDPTFSAPPLTTTTMAPGSSALAQALGVGDPGVSYLSKKGKERKPVWNVESLKLSDELGGNYG